MKNKTKTIIKILIVALLGAASVVYFMFNKPHTNVAKSKADISISAYTLINDFETDETKANTMYLEKIVDVTGVIAELSFHKEKGIVTIKSEDVMGNVLCHLSKDESEKVKELKEGATVSIKGICTGYLMDVVLVKCVIN